MEEGKGGECGNRLGGRGIGTDPENRMLRRNGRGEEN